MLLTRAYSRVGVGEPKRQLDYGEIGHGFWDPNAETFYSFGKGSTLWVWQGGSFLKESAMNEKGHIVSHTGIWGTQVERFFRGRYDANTGEISMIVPERMRFRDVPSALIRDLDHEFPGHGKIHTFNQESGGRESSRVFTRRARRCSRRSDGYGAIIRP
jgi:hypothetical protein